MRSVYPDPSSREVNLIAAPARQEGRLVVCAPVYAELLAYPGATRDFVDTFLEDTQLEVQ